MGDGLQTGHVTSIIDPDNRQQDVSRPLSSHNTIFTGNDQTVGESGPE